MKYKITIKGNGKTNYIQCDDYLLLAEQGKIKLDIMSSKKDDEEVTLMLMPLFEVLQERLDKKGY